MDFFEMVADNLFDCNSQKCCGYSSVLCRDSKGSFEISLAKGDEDWFIAINRVGNDANELPISSKDDAISILKRWKENGLIGSRQFMKGLGFDSAKFEIEKIKEGIGAPSSYDYED